jgi:L-threonylcarbamoyladenylate synthase
LAAAASREAIAHAVHLLREGKLVAFPTETVYGLGADAGNPQAVRAIFAAKGRPADHPVIVHVPDSAHATHWTQSMPDDARALAAAFWPGPLTMILPRSTNATDDLTGGLDRIGVRVPSHPIAQALLRGFVAAGGAGIAAPSANRFGRISPTTAQHVADDLGSAVDLILDGGPCDVGIESTIVAFGEGEPMLLRPGGIPAGALARVLGRMPRAPSVEAPRASGTLPSHYAPRTPSRLIESGDLAWIDASAAVLARTLPRPANWHASRWIVAPDEPVRYAHDLYANLRMLDAVGAKILLIEAVPDHTAWQAVRDRLARATRGDEDDRD